MKGEVEGRREKKKESSIDDVLFLSSILLLLSLSLLHPIFSPSGAQWSLAETHGGSDLGTPLGQNCAAASAAALPSAADACSVPATASFIIASVTPRRTPGGSGCGRGC